MGLVESAVDLNMELSAMVVRADGSIENLGVIAATATQEPRRAPLWRKALGCIGL